MSSRNPLFIKFVEEAAGISRTRCSRSFPHAIRFHGFLMQPKLTFVLHLEQFKLVNSA